MKRKRSLAGIFILLAACGAELGRRNNPIASANFSFAPSLANELSSRSRDFAADNRLDFQDDKQGTARQLTLRNDEVRIEVTIADDRLDVVGLGPVTPQSVKLVHRYIDAAQDVQ